MQQWLIVFLGGGLGSSCRYLLSQYLNTKVATIFPLGTFTVNLVGCLLIGLSLAIMERAAIHPGWVLLMATGFCGGFTTFSSFQYENYLYLKNEQYLIFLVYLFTSFFWGMGAIILGFFLVKKLS